MNPARVTVSCTSIMELMLAAALAAGAEETSVEVSKSSFKPIAEYISYEGRDMFELAVRAGMYPRTGKGAIPHEERGALSAGGLTWHGSNGAGLVAYDPTMKRYSIYYFQKEAVPGHHLSLHYADGDYVFFSYGSHRGIPDVESALEVYSLKRRRFARIERVSTREAKWGKFSQEVLRRNRTDIPGTAMPAMEWNDLGHSGKAWIRIQNTAYFSHPERMELVDGVYRLHYHRSWNISEFETILRFSKVDLDKELEKGGK